MSDSQTTIAVQDLGNLHLHPARPVTAQDIADFERDGVVCLRGMFDEAWCGLLHDAAMEVMASGQGRVREPEQVVQLPEMEPIYITYLTAIPQGTTIAFHDDVYARDGVQLAAVDTDRARSDRP